jgi:antibiotic biosynthesis monooxygenase (ABM) superfamily enzyme
MSMIEAIPHSMRDNLYEELNAWHNSPERERYLKRIEEAAQKRAQRRHSLIVQPFRQPDTPQINLDA